MVLYHEIASDTLSTILREGLKRASRGKKGDESAIKQTDSYLDDRRPDTLRSQGVSRDDNIYAFVGTEEEMVDIRDGRTVALSNHPDPGSCLLRLAIHPQYCYVSDLDRYDAVKQAVEQQAPNLSKLAADYWQHVIPLADYEPGSIHRPEVMITCDLPPSALTHINTL